MKSTNFPIIIGGCGRSGTTLLLAILGSHPNIFAIPEETRVFCPTAYGSTPDLSAPLCIDDIDPFLDKYVIPASCTRWCEKTPKNVLFLGPILKVFSGEVKLLHVVRDGRDVITSIHPTDPERFHVSAARWISEVSHGLAFLDHPQVLTIRYEDLVLDFKNTAHRICLFLGEEFKAQLVRWHYYTNIRWQNSWEGGVVRPLYDGSIGRWNLPEYAAIVAELVSSRDARKCLERLGYSLEQPLLSADGKQSRSFP